MERSDLASSFGFLMSDTARLLRKHFDQHVRPTGLTRAQWRVLVNLARTPGINQTTLADLLEIEPITLCRQIDRMEDAGWVRREVDPNDRRAWLIYMTEQAAPMLHRIYAVALDVNAEAFAAVSAVELEAVVGTLMKIRANLLEKGPDCGVSTAD